MALWDTVPPPWLVLLAHPLGVRVGEGEKASDRTALAVKEDAPRKEGVGGWELLAELVEEKRRGDSDDIGDNVRVGELEVQPVEEAEREGEEVLEEVTKAVREADGQWDDCVVELGVTLGVFEGELMEVEDTELEEEGVCDA